MDQIPDTPDELLEQLDANPAQFTPKYSVAFIWNDILDNIEVVSADRIEIGVAVTVAARYSHLGLRIQDVPLYFKLYNELLTELREILRFELEQKPKYADFVNEEDAEKNRDLYLSIVVGWNLQIAQWEKDFSYTDPDAHILVCAINDATAFVMGERGLLPLLDQIQFDWTEEEQGVISTALREFAGVTEGAEGE